MKHLSTLFIGIFIGMLAMFCICANVQVSQRGYYVREIDLKFGPFEQKSVILQKNLYEHDNPDDWVRF